MNINEQLSERSDIGLGLGRWQPARISRSARRALRHQSTASAPSRFRCTNTVEVPPFPDRHRHPVARHPRLPGFYGTPPPGAPKYAGAVAGRRSGSIRAGTPLDRRIHRTRRPMRPRTHGISATAPHLITTASPQHTYRHLGVFTVTLTVTAPTGGTPSHAQRIRHDRVHRTRTSPRHKRLSGRATWTAAGFSGNDLRTEQQAESGTSTTST